MHHVWKDRFKTALKNKNWKKILSHEVIEYSWLGSWIMALEGSPESWIIGISGAFVIHMIVFEAIDALYKKERKWLSWFMSHDHL
jgi:hypothetical protein